MQNADVLMLAFTEWLCLLISLRSHTLEQLDLVKQGSLVVQKKMLLYTKEDCFFTICLLSNYVASFFSTCSYAGEQSVNHVCLYKNQNQQKSNKKSLTRKRDKTNE